MLGRPDARPPGLAPCEVDLRTVPQRDLAIRIPGFSSGPCDLAKSLLSLSLGSLLSPKASFIDSFTDGGVCGKGRPVSQGSSDLFKFLPFLPPGRCCLLCGLWERLCVCAYCAQLSTRKVLRKWPLGPGRCGAGHSLSTRGRLWEPGLGLRGGHTQDAAPSSCLGCQGDDPPLPAQPCVSREIQAPRCGVKAVDPRPGISMSVGTGSHWF